MTKTPEQMAEEFGTGIDLCCGTSDIIIAAEKAFLAGYQAAQQWISVKERLPEYDVEVLTFETGNYKVNAVSEYTQWWWDSNEGFKRNPTHWQPLPKPPEEA
jgi:hypothetical protein